WVNNDPDVSYEDLVAISDKAMELAPNLTEAHAARGKTHQTAGRPERTTLCFQQAINQDPLLFSAHFWYGLSRRDLRQMAESAALFQRAAKLRPDDFNALAHLANVLKAQGLMEESKAAARRGLIRVEAILKQRPMAPDVLAL